MGQQIFLPAPAITIKEDKIQGDVLVGLQKRAEIFAFFKIATKPESLADFRTALTALIPMIATSAETRNYEINHGPMVVKTNIAFTATGLKTLKASGIRKSDKAFRKGMKARAADLGDTETEWLPAYAEHDFDGVLLIAAWDKVTATAASLAAAKLAAIQTLFGGSLHVAHQELGTLNAAAPGHEVFGFADGVSQPAVEGLHKPVTAEDQSFAGQDIVKLGDFILGNYDKEDGTKATPPAPWMENGSYMVFRRLRQHVHTFNTYVAGNFSGVADSPDHLGALLIGRWKDGTPIARDPLQPNAAHDESQPTENNDFEFGIPAVGQSRCPFSSHIRRVYPRSDIQFGTGHSEARRILRAGIAFDHTTASPGDEGLLFVCYQSSIVDKFEFIQTAWANQSSIPFAPPYPSALKQNMPAKPGIDLIIGQGTAPRNADWTVDNVAGPARTLSGVPKFVTATGGEYFFSPSIDGLSLLAQGTA